MASGQCVAEVRHGSLSPCVLCRLVGTTLPLTLWGDRGQPGMAPAPPQMCEVLAQHQPQPVAAVCLGRTAHTRRKERPGVRGQGNGQRPGFRDREKGISWVSVGGVRGRGQDMLAVTRGGVSGQMAEEWVAWCLCEWTEGLGLDEGGRAWMEGWSVGLMK